METTIIKAQPRGVAGKQVKQLRQKGLIPAVVYGHGEPKNITVEYASFEKTLAKAGESSLIDLETGTSAPEKVLIQDVQRHPLKGTLAHVDFRRVSMTEKLDVEVSLRFVGESPAVKALGGVFVRNRDTIQVRCLAQYLVHEIEIDISNLKAFGDMIKVKDLTPPEGMEFLAGASEVLASVIEPISEAELAALDQKVEADVSAVKVVSEEKKKADEAAKAEEEKEKKG